MFARTYGLDDLALLGVLDWFQGQAEYNVEVMHAGQAVGTVGAAL